MHKCAAVERTVLCGWCCLTRLCHALLCQCCQIARLLLQSRTDKRTSAAVEFPVNTGIEPAVSDNTITSAETIPCVAVTFASSAVVNDRDFDTTAVKQPRHSCKPPPDGIGGGTNLSPHNLQPSSPSMPPLPQLRLEHCISSLSYVYFIMF